MKLYVRTHLGQFCSRVIWTIQYQLLKPIFPVLLRWPMNWHNRLFYNTVMACVWSISTNFTFHINYWLLFNSSTTLKPSQTKQFSHYLFRSVFFRKSRQAPPSFPTTLTQSKDDSVSTNIIHTNTQTFGMGRKLFAFRMVCGIVSVISPNKSSG